MTNEINPTPAPEKDNAFTRMKTRYKENQIGRRYTYDKIKFATKWTLIGCGTLYILDKVTGDKDGQTDYNAQV